MDFKEREALCRRIMSAKLYCNIKYRYDEYRVLFYDPALNILTQADFIYQSGFDQCKDREDILTIDETVELLKDQDQWSDEDEVKLKKLRSDIETFKTELNHNKFNKSQQRLLTRNIKIANDEINKLELQKNQLISSSIEFINERIKKRFIISKISKIKNGPTGWKKDNNFLDNLAYHYFDKFFIPEGKIREIARSDPWRVHWTLSKDTGTRLFDSATNITQNQYRLILWSRIYDFAYNYSSPPSDDIVKDDEKFDAWYNNVAKEIESNNKKNSLDNDLSKAAVGAQEVYVPADVEGAQEVYQLNDFVGRGIVQSRQKIVEEKKEVHHIDLPDVKMDLQMAVNRLSSQRN